MPNYGSGPACWNTYCLVKGCDGVHHCGHGLRTWTQPVGWIYNPATSEYEPPAQETDVDPRNASPRP